MTTLTSCRFCQPLEPRRLFATTYDFGALTGYTSSGVTSTYDYSYNYTAAPFGAGADDGDLTVTSARSGTTANRKHTITADTDTAFGDTVRVFRANAQTINLTKFQTSGAGAVLNLTLAGTRVAPRNAVLGTPYSDAGTFTGTFDGTIAGITGSGTVSGTTNVVTRLRKVVTITTPAGTFSTVRGTSNLTFTGTIEGTVLGTPFVSPFTATYNTTFWGAENAGIVRQRENINISLTVFGSPINATATTNSNLASRNPAPTAPQAKASPLFSAKPILASADDPLA